MKKSWSILFIGLFLVTSLYSAQVFLMTSDSVGIVTEPNMTNDFAPSIDYIPSEQSITSFAETLPNNVLFYPDGTQLEKDESPKDGGIYYFEAGDLSGTCYMTAISDFDGDYDALVLNGDGLDGMGTGGGVVSNGFPLRFNLNVTISSYSEGAGSDMYLRLIAFSGITLGGEENYFVQEDIDGNGELIIDAECGLSSVGSMLVMVDFSGSSEGDTVNVTCNSYYFYTKSGSGYLESFADVNDWQFELESSPDGYNFTTDGDVATLALGYDDASNEAIRYNTTLSGISITDYIEYRWITSPSSGSTLSTALTIYLDDIVIGTRAITGDWATTKLYVGDYCTVAPTTLAIHADDWGNGHATDSGYVKLDYVRIGPADEMGFSHDGSTTAGITEYSGNVSSDGDTVSVIGNGESGCGIFWVDATSNKSVIESDYYPFLAIDITNIDATYWSLGYATTNTPTTWYDFSWFITDETDDGVFRVNINSLGIDPSNIAILSQYGTVEVEYIKAYSIANYTFSQSGSSTVSDVLYVDDGVLISDKTSGTYIALVYDPILSIDTSQFTYANVSIPANFTWLGGGTYGFAITVTVSGDSDTQYDETQFGLDSGTLTDFSIFVNGVGNMSEISFLGIGPQWWIIDSIDLIFDTKGWNTIDTIILYFYTGTWDWGINIVFLFLGLAMIPGSTIYFVKGGRGEMSTDKLLVVILCFFMGCALFLGGIFG